MEGEDLGPAVFQAGKDQVEEVRRRAPVESHQLIQRRECRGDFQQGTDPGAEAGKKRPGPPGVAGVRKPGFGQRGPARCTGLPAGRRERGGRGSHNFGIHGLGPVDFPVDFLSGHGEQFVVPAHVIIAMEAYFVAGGPNAGQQAERGPADAGGRQHGAVQHGGETVNRRSPGTQHFLQKTPAGGIPERWPGRSCPAPGPQKRGPDLPGGENFKEGGYALGQATQGVNIHFQT